MQSELVEQRHWQRVASSSASLIDNYTRRVECYFWHLCLVERERERERADEVELGSRVAGRFIFA